MVPGLLQGQNYLFSAEESDSASVFRRCRAEDLLPILAVEQEE
jgi:hypothetical protein